MIADMSELSLKQYPGLSSCMVCNGHTQAAQHAVVTSSLQATRDHIYLEIV